ncbi:MAG: hypothetical protein AAGG02_06755 [Cyanobacteria bacterium P01_H01_bin.15]
MDSPATVNSLKPRQIVCLETTGDRLFAEVIEIITPRKMCWARPLVLCRRSIDDEREWADLLDLRATVDLLLPVHWFRPAWDHELLPLLGEVLAQENAQELSAILSVKSQLNRFIEATCRNRANQPPLDLQA